MDLKKEKLSENGNYLDESVYFSFPAFGQRFDLYLTDATNVQVVDCWTPPKTEGKENTAE